MINIIKNNDIIVVFLKKKIYDATNHGTRSIDDRYRTSAIRVFAEITVNRSKDRSCGGET